MCDEPNKVAPESIKQPRDKAEYHAVRRNEMSQYIAPLHEDKMSRRLQP